MSNGWYDISAPLTDQLPTWPTSRGWTREFTRDVRTGDAVTETFLSMDVHCGTHVDGPLHHLSNGAAVHDLPVEAFWGPCDVIDARGRPVIDEAVVSTAVPEDSERVLFLTDNSVRRLLQQPAFDSSFVGISVEAAELLAGRSSLKLVGNDYLSVQPYDASDKVHQVLMDAGVALLEGVDLSAVVPGRYELCALPLAIPGAEAAPARAVLRRLDYTASP